MAYRSSSGTPFTGTSTLTATAPAGVTAGDRLLAVVIQDVTPQTITPPSGWTSLGSNPNSGPDTQWFELFEKKVATGSDSYAFTSGSTNDAVVQVVCLSGRHASTAAVVTTAVDNTANATPISVNAASVTATLNDDILVFVDGDTVSSSDVWSTTAVPASYTKRQDTQQTFAYGACYTRDAVSAGATGTLTSTLTRSSGTSGSGWGTFTVAVPAAAAAAPATVYRAKKPLPHPALRDPPAAFREQLDVRLW